MAVEMIWYAYAVLEEQRKVRGTIAPEETLATPLKDLNIRGWGFKRSE